MVIFKSIFLLLFSFSAFSADLVGLNVHFTHKRKFGDGLVLKSEHLEQVQLYENEAETVDHRSGLQFSFRSNPISDDYKGGLREVLVQAFHNKAVWGKPFRLLILPGDIGQFSVSDPKGFQVDIKIQLTGI